MERSNISDKCEFIPSEAPHQIYFSISLEEYLVRGEVEGSPKRLLRFARNDSYSLCKHTFACVKASASASVTSTGSGARLRFKKLVTVRWICCFDA